MPMVVTARRFTVDEVLTWPDDGNRYELVDGVLLVTPAPMPPHQIVALRIAAALRERVRSLSQVHVASPGAILVRPGVKMEPDILVFRSASVPARWEEVEEHWLAVEVWSPSSVVYDRDIKRDAYLQLGVREVWLVAPEARTVFVSRPGAALDLPRRSTLVWRPPGAPDAPPIDLAETFRDL